MSKVLESIMVEVRINNEKVVEIEVPANYKPIFEEIASGKASTIRMSMYDQLAAQLNFLSEQQKQKYRDLLFSGKFRTEKMRDLLHILDKVEDYFVLFNTSSFVELGLQFAIGLILSGDIVDVTPIDKNVCYAVGKEMYERLDGFFVEDRFYGKIAILKGEEPEMCFTFDENYTLDNQ